MFDSMRPGWQDRLDGSCWSDWWARQGSNLRPLGCKPSALPLSYAPGSRTAEAAR
jgi:hypothetical protein